MVELSSPLLGSLGVFGMLFLRFLRLKKISDLPFFCASFLHRKFAWRVLGGKLLEHEFVDAVEKYGFGSKQAIAIEEKIDRLKLALQLGRLLSPEQEQWHRQAVSRGLPLSVSRCFIVNRNVEKTGKFKFRKYIEYGVATVYVISAILALVFLLLNLIPLFEVWPYVSWYQRAIVLLLYVGVFISIVSLGYLSALPTYYYWKYFE